MAQKKSTAKSAKAPVTPKTVSTAVSTDKMASTKTASSAGAASAARAEQQPPSLPFGFDSLAGLVSFGLLCLLFAYAPYGLSGFWVVALDAETAMWLPLTAGICLLMALAPESRGVPRPGLVARCFTLFFGLCALSLGSAIYRHDALIEMSRLIGCIAWFFVARTLLSSRSGEAANGVTRDRGVALLGAIAVGAVVVSVIAIYSWVQVQTRQFSTFFNPNLFANYCAMSLPIVVAWGFEMVRTARRKGVPGRAVGGALLAAVAGFIVLAGLLVSYSKGGLLAMACGMVVATIGIICAKPATVRDALKRYRLQIAIVVCVLLLICVPLLLKTVLPRLMSARGSEDNSTMFRVYTWRGTWNMALAKPMTGWGPGSYASAFSQFAIAGNTRSAHQLWLQIAAEHGIPALLILAATVVAALARGWQQLRTSRWPTAAGSLGTLTAFVVHGLTDAGWGITSIVLLFVAVLALLDTGEVAEPTAAAAAASAEVATHRTRLNLGWIVACLPCAMGAVVLQHAWNAENLMAEANREVQRGNGSMALQKAREATVVDPLNAAAWTNLAFMEEAAGQDPQKSYELAIELQPTRPANYVNLARAAAADKVHISQTPDDLYTRAIALAPNETYPRLQRAQWRLAKNDPRAWDDFEAIAGLADQPFGKYPAVPEMVNLDFAQAYVKLAERALSRNKRDEARNLVERGLADVATARANEEHRRELEQATGEGIDSRRAAVMDELETELKSLKERSR